MKKLSSLVFIPLLAATATLSLVSCGGSGGSSSSGVSVTGTVAVGAPIAGGAVTVYDSSGTEITTSVTNDSGAYDVTIPSGSSAPFLIKVEFGDQVLYSIKATADSGVANVNQLTHALSAMLSTSGNPSKLTSELASGDTAITESGVNEKSELLSAAIAPVVAKVEADSAVSVGDFLSSSFTANGTGLDKVLDSVSLSVTAFTGTSGVENSLEVTYNVPTDLESNGEPTSISFTSTSTKAAIDTLAAGVTINQLPVDNLPSMYLEFLERMQACYDIPLADRASNGAVTAQACKNIFYEQDPNNYRDGGYGVGPNRFKSMVSSSGKVTFSQVSRGILLQDISLSNGALSGRALISFSSEDEAGDRTYWSMVTRVFTLNGEAVLGAYGDQNLGEFYVNSEASVIHHPLHTDTSLDYVVSGYAIYAPAYEPSGKTIKTAILTTPKKKLDGTYNKIVMGKQTGRSSLRICKASEYNATTNIPTGSCTLTPLLVQGLMYVDEDPDSPTSSPYQDSNIRKFMAYSKTEDNTVTCTHMAYTANGQTVQPLCPRTDTEISNQRAGGLWKLVITYNDDSQATFWYRHPVRAMTVKELLGPTGPNVLASKLTAPTIDRFKQLNESAVADGRAFSTWLTGSDGIQKPIWAPAEGGYQFDWTTPEGGVNARQVYMSGKLAYWENISTQAWCRGVSAYNGACQADGVDHRPVWDEKLRFRSGTTSKTLGCTNFDDEDVGCAGTTGTWVDRNSDLTNIDNSQATENFARGAWMSYSNLWTKDQDQRNLIRGYNFFTP